MKSDIIKSFKKYMIIQKYFLGVKNWKKNPYLFLKSFCFTFKFFYEEIKFSRLCKKYGKEKAYAMLDRRI